MLRYNLDCLCSVALFLCVTETLLKIQHLNCTSCKKPQNCDNASWWRSVTSEWFIISKRSFSLQLNCIGGKLMCCRAGADFKVIWECGTCTGVGFKKALQLSELPCETQLPSSVIMKSDLMWHKLLPSQFFQLKKIYSSVIKYGSVLFSWITQQHPLKSSEDLKGHRTKCACSHFCELARSKIFEPALIQGCL